MTKPSLFAIAFYLALLALLSGCGGHSNPVTPVKLESEFVYAATWSGPPNLESRLSTYTFNSATGVLSLSSTITLPTFPVGVAVDAAAKSLYLSSPLTPPHGVNLIDIYSINPTTGVPAPAGAISLDPICAFCNPPSGPGALALSPNAKFLYYGSSTAGGGITQGIGALSVDSGTRALSIVPGSPFPADEIPFNVLVHPSGRFLYTENLSETLTTVDSVSAFSIDPATGALTPVAGSPFVPPASTEVGGGLAIHPSGKFLYAGSVANGLLGWSIDASSGAISALPGSPFQSSAAIFGPATFSATGQFLYASAGPDLGGIYGFAVDGQTGALSPLPGSPFSSGTFMGTPLVDPSGQFMFARDTKNSSVATFSLDPMTGKLTLLGKTQVPDAFFIYLNIAKIE